MPLVRRRWQDHAFGTDPPSSTRQVLRRPARPGKRAQVHAELAARVVAPKIDDVEVSHLKPPQPSALVGRVDGAARRRAPFGPRGLGVERRVERPRIAGPMAARLPRCRSVGREGRRVEAGLTMDPAGEGADGAQT